MQQKHNENTCFSILSPPITTRHTLIEACHRLIRTANLHLEERRLVTIAALGRTLHSALLCVVPRAGTAKDIFTLLTLVDTPRVDGFGDCVFEGTGAAFEAVGAVEGEGDGEDVGAMGADYSIVSKPHPSEAL
jgi:hypothetical protein